MQKEKHGASVENSRKKGLRTWGREAKDASPGTRDTGGKGESNNRHGVYLGDYEKAKPQFGAQLTQKKKTGPSEMQGGRDLHQDRKAPRGQKAGPGGKKLPGHGKTNVKNWALKVAINICERGRPGPGGPVGLDAGRKQTWGKSKKSGRNTQESGDSVK